MSLTKSRHLPPKSTANVTNSKQKNLPERLYSILTVESSQPFRSVWKAPNFQVIKKSIRAKGSKEIWVFKII